MKTRKSEDGWRTATTQEGVRQAPRRGATAQPPGTRFRKDKRASSLLPEASGTDL